MWLDELLHISPTHTLDADEEQQQNQLVRLGVLVVVLGLLTVVQSLMLDRKETLMLSCPPPLSISLSCPPQTMAARTT